MLFASQQEFNNDTRGFFIYFGPLIFTGIKLT